MKYVVDSSTLVKWEVNVPDSATARRLRDEARRGLLELHAPDILPVEVANALHAAELKGAVVPGGFELHLASVLSAGPILHQSTSLLPRATAIIRMATTRVGIYDCLYVALAEREGCELVTSDAKLIRALGGPYPFLVPLSALP